MSEAVSIVIFVGLFIGVAIYTYTIPKKDLNKFKSSIFEKEELYIDETEFLSITNFLIDTTNSNIKMIINIIEKIKLFLRLVESKGLFLNTLTI